MDKPTPSSEWVKAGDRCIVSQTGWIGTVEKVVPLRSLPYAVVRWDKTGEVGRMTITHLRRL